MNNSYEIRSRFRFQALLPMIFLLPFAIGFIAGVLLMNWGSETMAIVIYIFIIVFLSLVLAWAVFDEVRTKAIKVIIGKNQISVRGYFGFGSETTYFLSDFDRFITSQVPTKYRTFEYLYLLKDNKRLIKLSEYYHKNYEELKQAISEEVDYSGDQPFRMSQEVKEMFRRR
jgi:hypothetical protein